MSDDGEEVRFRAWMHFLPAERPKPELCYAGDPDRGGGDPEKHGPPARIVAGAWFCERCAPTIERIYQRALARMR